MVMMALDKRAARRGRRRVPERVLWSLGAAGGTLGLIAAMWMLRHKNRKPAWSWGLPLLLLAQGWAIGAWLGWW